MTRRKLTGTRLAISSLTEPDFGFCPQSPVDDAVEPVAVAADDRLVGVEVLVRQRGVDAVPVEVGVGDVVEEAGVELAGARKYERLTTTKNMIA